MNKIGLIINVQRPGEHPYCGKNTLDELSGFSYSPSLFSSEGIIVKLYGWKDMDVPDSFNFMLDIVKEMLFTVNEKKKVLVHCHAGKGRTGIVIACYLMFKYNISAQEAIKKVREGRKGAIQNNEQIQFCLRFFQCIFLFFFNIFVFFSYFGFKRSFY
jgi:protein tyrosine phosphatase domain-containing protein 1